MTSDQESPFIVQPRQGLFPSLCASPSRRPSSYGCSVVPNTPPQKPDPWIYDTTAVQIAQISAWEASPKASTPPTFWVPDSSWQLANPGWAMAIPFWLPDCGINVYSSYDPNELPPAPSPVVQVSVGNNSKISAINTLVQLSMSYLGIGRKRIPIANQLASIGPGGKVSLNFAIPSSFLNETVTQQWRGAYVDLKHPYDRNVANDHAISMWIGVDTTQAGGPGSYVGAVVPLVNEFSTATEQVTLIPIPLIDGVVVNGPLGPFTLMPAQTFPAGLSLTIPDSMDSGTFLAPMATVVGVDSKGNFVGALTIVGSVND